MNRRHALKLFAAAPFLSAPLTFYAAPGANARLLVVFMRGGYDAASLLVPFASDFYYEARPNIAVPKPGTAPNAAIALDADWGLHPAVRTSLAPLYEKGELAFVPYAGTRDLSRSHFETQGLHPAVPFEQQRFRGGRRARVGEQRRDRAEAGLGQRPDASDLCGR